MPMEGSDMRHLWRLNYQSMIILVAEMVMACGNSHVVAFILLRVMLLPTVDDLIMVVVIWTRRYWSGGRIVIGCLGLRQIK